jgi:hypothetical protein
MEGAVRAARVVSRKKRPPHWEKIQHDSLFSYCPIDCFIIYPSVVCKNML